MIITESYITFVMCDKIIADIVLPPCLNLGLDLSTMRHDGIICRIEFNEPITLEQMKSLRDKLGRNLIIYVFEHIVPPDFPYIFHDHKAMIESQGILHACPINPPIQEHVYELREEYIKKLESLSIPLPTIVGRYMVFDNKEDMVIGRLAI